MKDREFLIWIHARLTDIHDENPHMDYMHKLRAIIKSTPGDKETPNMGTDNSLEDLMEELNNLNHWLKGSIMSWISVEERLPEKKGLYLCYCPHTEYKTDCKVRIVSFGYVFNRRFAPTYVTHWMPLPSLPDKE